MGESFRTLSAPPAQLWQVLLGHLASLERLVPHKSSLNALSAVAFEDTAVSQVRSSLAPGAIVLGGAGESVLVDGVGQIFSRGFDSGHQLRIYTYTRMHLGRGGAHTTSIVSCPGCGWSRSCYTSIFSR